MFEKEIDSYLETMASFITKKAVARADFAKTKAELTILMAKHINKSSASFENKIQLLLQIPEITEKVQKLSDSFIMNECLWKNYRDFADLYRLKIIESQSRRKEKNIL